MAMHVPKPPGFAQMLKDGAKVSKLKEKKNTDSRLWCGWGDPIGQNDGIMELSNLLLRPCDFHVETCQNILYEDFI